MQKKLSFRAYMQSFFVLLLVEISVAVASAATITTNLAFIAQPVSTMVGAPLTNVVVQIRDSRGTNILQSGIGVALVLSKGTGLTGTTSVKTDATGKAAFTNLIITQFGSGDLLQSLATNLSTVTSIAFNIAQGKTTNVMTVSANQITYGQSVTLTSKMSIVAPSSGTLTGTVTFKDGNAIVGIASLNASAQAILITTNRFPAGIHNLTAVFGGNTNFATSTSAIVPLTVSKLTLTVSGIVASNKVYDAKVATMLNASNAMLIGILSGENVALNATAAKGTFADKMAGTGKDVFITGLTISGTNASNYTLVQPTAKASIGTASLMVTAKGVNKVYDSTTKAMVTLSDNRIAGDVLLNSYGSAVFTNKNIGVAKTIIVSGITSSGTDAANYTLNSSTVTTTANITAGIALSVSGILASNKVYDGKTIAGLNLSRAVLVGVLGSDSVGLVKTNSKGLFANKNVGAGKPVAISGLTIAGADATNYTLSQPVAMADVTAASLTLTAKGVNKVYDGTTIATVSLTDNRVTGDMLTDNYASSIFAKGSVDTNISISVSGVSITGADSSNYFVLNTNATAAGNITAAKLLVIADSLSRPFGITNSPLTFSFAGFVNGETAATNVTGIPILTTTAKTNSAPGNYPITITKGTLAATNYALGFSNGILNITPASTAALVTSGLNPARTNQSIMFVTKISAMNKSGAAPTGLVRLKSNGIIIGNPISLTNGTTTLMVPAAMLGSGNVLVSAEFFDPSGNFNASTNSIHQGILVAVPSIDKVSVSPPNSDGTMRATLSGTPGQTFILEASSDLIHWSPIFTNVADTNGLVTIVETNAVNNPSRFYRGMMP